MTDLRQPVRIDLASSLRRVPEMAAAIAVQGTEHSVLGNHFLQPSHHRQRRFFLAQLCVIDLAGGVIQDHDQVIPAFVLEPLMMATIDVQQHARQRGAEAGACDARLAFPLVPPDPLPAAPASQV